MIGIDVLEIERVKDFENNENLLQKVFTQSEIEYIKKFKDPKERIAGFFCAKEAVLKALGCPKTLSMIDIEVLHNKNGSPYINFTDKLKSLNIKKIEISISHSKTIASAICQVF